jgi:hypothetical protein
MKVVFVSSAHPQVAHVSGMRVPTFARVLAQRRHQIVHFTRTLADTGPVTVSVQGLASALRAHDFRTPFHIPCPPRVEGMLRAIGRQAALARSLGRRGLGAVLASRHGQ